MPDAFLDQLCEVDQTDSWRRNLLKHGVSGRKRVLVAVGGAGVIGFVRVGPAAEASEIGLVYLLYVLPQYWGCRVGQTLMRAAIGELHKLGMREAVLWVLRDNQRARQFYDRLGWRPNGQTHSAAYGGVQLEALCYQQTLVV
jgi:GNAT superfamily N-acetyltransferase